MSLRSSCVVPFVLVALFAGACESTPSAAAARSSDTQAIVDAVAKEHPEVARLTVHMVPPAGGASVAVASTLPQKHGKPSDPEDLQVMSTGRPIVLPEGQGWDVTVPALPKGARWEAAVGVTFQPNPELGKERFIEMATAIARVVEDRMLAARK